MHKLIEKYIENMNKDDIKNFALKKGVILNNDETDFIYYFIKNNYEQILKNPASVNLDNYQNHFSNENFDKIKKVYNEYFFKYQNYL